MGSMSLYFSDCLGEIIGESLMLMWHCSIDPALKSVIDELISGKTVKWRLFSELHPHIFVLRMALREILGASQRK